MKKNILLILTLILTLTLTAVFAACGAHQHEFSDKWTYDGSNHWHAAVCGDTDEVSDKAPHNMLAVPGDTRLECEVCGYSKQQTVKPNPDPDPEPQPKPHEHTYSTQLSSDENGHWYAATCEHADQITVLKHVYVDGICKDCGWWSSASEVLFANLSKSEVWNYALLFDNVVLNDVNLLSEGLEHVQLTVSGELKLSMAPNGQIDGCGSIEAEDLSLKAVVQSGVVYACGSGVYVRCNLDELLKQNSIDVKAYIDEIDSRTQAIKEYYNRLSQSVGGLPVDGAVIGELLNSVIKKDETKSTDSISVYVPDVESLRTLNRTLASLTVEDYADAVLGELLGTPLGALLGDSLSGLPAKVRSLLSKPIAQSFAALWTENFTLDDLLNQLNEYIANYYPDENVNNVDELVAALGINLNGVSVKNAIIAASALSPETLWNSMQQDASSQISAKEIADNLGELITAYGGKTVYELIAAIGAASAEEVQALVGQAIDWLEQNVSLEFYVGSDGVLQQVILSVSEQTVLLKRGYELQGDYSQVIESVNAYYDSQEAAA